jgi:hypothetical protein
MSEVRLWEAYHDDEPNRHTKADYYMAQMAMFADMARAGKPRTFRIRDYLLRFRLVRQAMSMEEAKERVVQWVTALAGMAGLHKGKSARKKRKGCKRDPK